MTDEQNKSDQEIEHPDTHYERRDLSPHAVLLFLVGLALVSVVIYFILWGFYGYLNAFRQQKRRPPTPLETMHDNMNTEQVIQRFPEPRLQRNPAADLNKFRAQEEQILNTYGWVDPQGGVAHIPIERAMDIIAARGLPVRQAPPAGAPQSAAPPPTPPAGAQ